MTNEQIMKTTIQFNNKDYQFDLANPISISTPFSNHSDVKAFFAPDTHIEPVFIEGFKTSTEEGGILNFKNIFINPHGNGTHTECVGHIANEPYLIKDCLKSFHHLGQLVTITPESIGEDKVLTKQQILDLDLNENINCILIRTQPNESSDKLKDWSGTNPPYIHHEAMQVLVDFGIEHFMIDLPSVDREDDDGKLLAHKTFWNYPSKKVRENATITEMIFAPTQIKDGLFLVNIQVLPITLDASPSNVVVYEVLND